MTELLDVVRLDRTELEQTVADNLREDRRRSLFDDKRAALVEQSDGLKKSLAGLVVTADSTDAIKEVQADLDVAEEDVRQLQKEADLSRLHHSRRQEFVKQLLEDRIEEAVETALARQEDNIKTTAEQQVADLLGQEGQPIATNWRRTDDGTAVSWGVLRQWVPKDSEKAQEQDTEDADITAEVSAGVVEFGDAQVESDLVVPEGGAELRVEADIGHQTQTLDPGGYIIHCRSIRDLVRHLELVDIEQRDASCTSSDRDALDIEIGRGDADDRPHVIELRSGDGGYSRRRTEAWTEYRDVDLDKEMALITVGQTSYYNNSMRGKQERTWLVGHDDGGYWTHQVYNTHETVEEALEFVKPAEVKRLEKQGRAIIQQGDVYFVEMKRASNFEDIEGTRHEVTEEDDVVVVSHPEHEDLKLEGEWKAITNIDGSQSGASSSSSRPGARD